MTSSVFTLHFPDSEIECLHMLLSLFLSAVNGLFSSFLLVFSISFILTFVCYMCCKIFLPGGYFVTCFRLSLVIRHFKML